jgi:hypothetical protein
MLGDTVWTAQESGFDSLQGQEIFLISTASRPALGPLILLSSGNWGQSCRGVKLITHVHVMQRFKMPGAVPPLPHIYDVVLN